MRCGRGILVKLFGNALDFEAFTFFREQEPFQQGNFQISTNFELDSLAIEWPFILH